LSRRTRSRQAPGERKSSHRGRSVEFAEHREYAFGDDFRHIDWNAFGRLEKLFLKLFVEEREQTVTVLLDRSASMQASVPLAAEAAGKFDFARKLAAALSYIALCSYDRVALGLLGTRLEDYQNPVRGRTQALNLFRFLEQAQTRGAGNLDAALADFARRNSGRSGLVIVLSDFLVPGAGITGLKHLRYQKNDVFVLQVLHPSELDPTSGGDFKLVDVEAAGYRELTLTRGVLNAYLDALEKHNQELEDWCTRNGCGYILATTREGLEALVVGALRKAGLLK
ncbi:MAG: DUF58 domain-containing protein, partial [Candidatus Eremiobacterota bacterium]